MTSSDGDLKVFVDLDFVVEFLDLDFVFCRSEAYIHGGSGDTKLLCTQPPSAGDNGDERRRRTKRNSKFEAHRRTCLPLRRF